MLCGTKWEIVDNEADLHFCATQRHSITAKQTECGSEDYRRI